MKRPLGSDDSEPSPRLFLISGVVKLPLGSWEEEIEVLAGLLDGPCARGISAQPLIANHSLGQIDTGGCAQGLLQTTCNILSPEFMNVDCRV